MHNYKIPKLVPISQLDGLDVGFELEFGSEYDPEDIANMLDDNGLAGDFFTCYEDGECVEDFNYEVEIVTKFWPMSEAFAKLDQFTKFIRDYEGGTGQGSSCHINITHNSNRELDAKWNEKVFTKHLGAPSRVNLLSLAIPQVGLHKHLNRKYSEGWSLSAIVKLMYQQREGEFGGEGIKGQSNEQLINAYNIHKMDVGPRCLYPALRMSDLSNDYSTRKRMEFRIGGGTGYHLPKGVEKIKDVTRTVGAYTLAANTHQEEMEKAASNNLGLLRKWSNAGLTVSDLMRRDPAYGL